MAALFVLGCVLLLVASLVHSVWRWVAYGLAGYFLLGAGGMLFYSKVGKLALRERLLDKIPWRGDERVLDVGCGRGLLAVGAAHRVSSGTVTGVDVWNRQAVSDNTAEAEDLTQETFLTVFRALRTFRGHSAFSSWLHRVTINRVLMHLRRKALTDASLEEIIRSGEESGSPRKELRHFDLRLKGLTDRLSIQKAIAQLPARLKGTFVLRTRRDCGNPRLLDGDFQVSIA